MTKTIELPSPCIEFRTSVFIQTGNSDLKTMSIRIGIFWSQRTFQFLIQKSEQLQNANNAEIAIYFIFSYLYFLECQI